jgi:SAM-dependent methyltransferase
MTDHDTLCGWGDRDKVAWIVENAETVIPKRRDQLAMLADLIPSPPGAEITVLDLGSGFGAVTEEILARHPNSSVTCVDGSAEMVKIARERMTRYGARVRLHHGDLADATWRQAIGGPFDGVVSALAIHHLSDQRKRSLYREAYELLLPGGIFLNNDIVTTPPALKARFEELNLLAIQAQDQRKRGKPRLLEEIRKEMRAQLQAAGPNTIALSRRSALSWNGSARPASSQLIVTGNISSLRSLAASRNSRSGSGSARFRRRAPAGRKAFSHWRKSCGHFLNWLNGSAPHFAYSPRRSPRAGGDRGAIAASSVTEVPSLNSTMRRGHAQSPPALRACTIPGLENPAPYNCAPSASRCRPSIRSACAAPARSNLPAAPGYPRIPRAVAL